MNFTTEYLGKLLLDYLNKNKDFSKIISIVKSNSKGNIYLIGGTVSRTLNRLIYGGKIELCDFDFIVDQVNEKISLPSEYTVDFEKFNNPTIHKLNSNIEIDIFPISDVKYIKENNLEPTIENFLNGSPFTIQSLAFDINTEKLIGDKGIQALKNKVFEINNKEAALYVAIRKGISIEERMKQKADSMNFTVNLD